MKTSSGQNDASPPAGSLSTGAKEEINMFAHPPLEITELIEQNIYIFP
jgi:hypothetical protein